MSEELETLERRIAALRRQARSAVANGERESALALRRELRDAERQWDEVLARIEAGSPADVGSALARGAQTATSADGATSAETGASGGRIAVAQASGVRGAGARRTGAQGGAAAALLPAREQVHQALSVLGVPAAPRLIVAVHAAFYPGKLAGSRLTSLRRDEERSFRAAPYSRPYYLCAALAADLLSPVRGLIAVSNWPLERRVIGPLSPRVDYLTAAVGVARRLRETGEAGPDARRLLWRFAGNIPNAAASFQTMSPDGVAAAAEAELAVHADADHALRSAAAGRARDQLGEAEQFFGAHLRVARRASAG